MTLPFTRTKEVRVWVLCWMVSFSFHSHCFGLFLFVGAFHAFLFSRANSDPEILKDCHFADRFLLSQESSLTSCDLCMEVLLPVS